MSLNLLDPNPPTSDDIFGARFNAKLTQQQAADLIGYSRRGWQDAENGKNKLHPAAWALFLLATGQHPYHKIVLHNHKTSLYNHAQQANKSNVAT